MLKTVFDKVGAALMHLCTFACVAVKLGLAEPCSTAALQPAQLVIRPNDHVMKMHLQQSSQQPAAD